MKNKTPERNVEEIVEVDKVIETESNNHKKHMTPNNNATEVNPFGYFKPADAMLPRIQETREAYSTVHKFLLTLPPSRQRAVAITELETSAMWAIKGLVLNDEGSTQPNESGVTGT